MSGITLLLISLAALISGALALFFYYYRSKAKGVQMAVLCSLRFISLFVVLLLLIDPQITSTEYYVEKPSLLLAVDNSTSIENLGASENVRDYVQSITENPEIRDRFEVKVYTFGRDLDQDRTLDFSEAQTNIPGALKSLQRLYRNEPAPTILITDGNQTLGEDFVFTASRYKNPLFPVVAGDTAIYEDLSVTRINVNKYAYLNNRFPVEMILNYSGKGEVITRVEIRNGGATVFTRDVVFSSSDDSEIVEAFLPASGTGVTTYEVELLPVDNEKNTENNTRRFAVEVIDERTSVLVVSDVLHPDLGTLKKSVETNQQRELTVHQISEGPVDTEAFELVILYQPNPRFKNLIEELEEKRKNYWIIAGPVTDHRFLNQVQSDFSIEPTGQTEEFFPVENQNFSTYQFGNMGFSGFPPLTGPFGEVSFNIPVEPLLYRRIQGITTDTPLLAVSDVNNNRKAFLFGVDIWKWRSHLFVENNSFEEFDNFTGKLVQFLAAGKRKDRLSVSYEPLYYGSEDVVITAEYFDQNYQFDPRAELNLRVINRQTEEIQQTPMILTHNRYEADLSSLPEGDYGFTVSVAGESTTRGGEFTLLGFDVEQQFGSANLSAMENVARAHGSAVYFTDNPERMARDLLVKKNLIPVQKSRQKDVPLVDWYYLLAIIAASLTIEWFLRKYYGFI